jgi:hypothetical protein
MPTVNYLLSILLLVVEVVEEPVDLDMTPLVVAVVAVDSVLVLALLKLLVDFLHRRIHFHCL